MDLIWWRSPTTFSLEFSLSLSSLMLSCLYVIFTLWLLWRYRDNFKSLDKRKWVYLGIATVLLIPAHAFLVLVYRASPVAAAPATILSSTPPVPLLGMLLVAIVAAWLGPAPGIALGLLSGFISSWFYPMAFNDVFPFVAWGLVIGILLNQPFKGIIFDLLRWPLVALPIASAALLGFLTLNRLVEAVNVSQPIGLMAIDYALSLLRTEFPLWLLSSIVQGLLLQALFLSPRLRPPQRSDVVSAYNRSLRARFMIIIIPLVLLSIILSVLAVTTRAVSLARVQSLVEMSRSAINASDAILQFYYTGFNLLSTFAEDPSLLYGNPELRMRVLETDYRVVPFFQEILLADAEGQVISSVPAGGMGEALTKEEVNAVDQALGLGISQFTPLTLLPSDVYGLTVVWPILPEDQDLPQGVLLGRVQLDVNPQMRRALDALQYAQGKDQEAMALDKRSETHGFIVDDRGLIIAHPDPEYIMRPWEPMVPYQSTSVVTPTLESTEDIEPLPTVPQYTSELGDDIGLAYEDVGPEGDRVLVYVREVEGTPYTVVLQLPFTSVLKTATAIASPLLWIQLSMGLLLLLAIPLLSTQITKPLNTLAEAANRISQGNLDIPVAISGEDEVAQLGGAFEKMRVRLQARLNDLSLLLQVSRAVSATLDMEQGVPPILQGALEETEAVVARFVLLGNGLGSGRGLGSAGGLGANRPKRIFTEGRLSERVTSSSEFEALDEAFVRVLTHRKDPLLIQDLLDTHTSTSQVADRLRPTALRSVASFPVRTQNRVVAILWVGSDEPEAFDAAHVNFLSTLSSQAAILVENARLFQAAEGGRRRLAAILASTTDCIMVTDQEGRLLMINPAGRSIWDLDERAYGRPVEDLGIADPLVQALNRSDVDPHTPPTVEVPLPDGRTFYASIAPIMGAAGLTMGRVAVMRDVTRFKELDEMKSEFVATVSHDLRAPLTFIRGYATMLMMVGELNDKQHEYLERILSGIDQMSALIGDLLNLRRIEAGVGIRQEPCRLGLILVEAVDAMRARASAKNIALRLQPADGAPTVTGDSTLLRQAISNLVDNAIKYTPSGGEVSVGMDVSKQEVVIRVSDTGIGISAEDQIRLFEKFHRIKRRETRKISGTGLGLALVKSIVERHGGRVWVESEINKGATFYIALPMDTEEHPPKDENVETEGEKPS